VTILINPELKRFENIKSGSVIAFKISCIELRCTVVKTIITKI